MARGADREQALSSQADAQRSEVVKGELTLASGPTVCSLFMWHLLGPDVPSRSQLWWLLEDQG
jgi:hypothetical protein